MPDPAFVPLQHERLADDEMQRRAAAAEARAASRRTTRHFSREPVPRVLLEHAIRTAGTAPSGAHMQPWTFVAVADPALKARIREAAEAEERRTYAERLTDEWRAALAPLGTDAVKAHLTDAPWVVVLFRQVHGWHPDGTKKTHYYTTESCGIAAGLFIQAIHEMGLVTLTHTPSPMGFLAELLGRPDHEKAFLVMPVGRPAPEAQVPALTRKPLDEISVWFDAPG
jgi:nitroreductase